MFRQKSLTVENALCYLHVTHDADFVVVKVADSNLDAYQKPGALVVGSDGAASLLRVE